MDITLSVEFLASLLGTDAAGITESLNGKEKKEHETFVKTKVQDLVKNAETVGRDTSHKRLTREINEEVEKKISKKLGVDVGSLDTMLDAFENKHATSDDEAKIRKSQTYLDDLKAEKARYAELESNHSKKLSAIESERVESMVKEKVLAHLTASNYVFSTNENVKKNQIDTFVTSFMKTNRFGLKEGKIQVLDSDGNPIRNSNLQEIEFDNFIVDRAGSNFDKNESDGRSSTDSKDDKSKAQSKIVVDPFKDHDDYFSRMSTETNPETQKAMAEMFDAQTAKGDFAK